MEIRKERNGTETRKKNKLEINENQGIKKIKLTVRIINSIHLCMVI